MTTSLEENSFNKNNPYLSKLLVNQMLTLGSDKETRHFEISLQGSGLSYEPGDSLGVLPFNCPKVVEDLMEATGFTGSEEIKIAEETICLKDALTFRFACTVLSKIQIKKFNELAQSSALDDLLKIENKEALIEYMCGRELIDLFNEDPQG